jgi:hypothetical protein
VTPIVGNDYSIADVVSLGLAYARLPRALSDQPEASPAVVRSSHEQPVHAQVHNHFNRERHLVTRQVYKQRRSSALVEWRALAA